jgi:uncharacterized membrane protein YkoI
MRTDSVYAIMAATVLLPCTAAIAAEVKVKMSDLPPAVQGAVKAQSKGATVRGLTKETENGKTEYEAELTVNGRNRDVSFDASGNVISVEDEVPLASVPNAARVAIQKAMEGGTLRKVELVKENGKTFYEATIRKAGKSSEIQVDPNGALIK